MKVPFRSSAILNIEIDDKHCFLWLILASLHPFKINHPNRVSNYRQNSDKVNIHQFDITIGFNCIDIQKIEKLNIISIILIEMNFYQDQKNLET